MKFCNDFITNSSSSSFIISSNDIGLLELFNGPFREFFNSMNEDYYYDSMDESDEDYKRDFSLKNIINNKDNGCAIHLKSGKELIDETYGQCDHLNEEQESELFYVISNNDAIRFNWNKVKEIFSEKYNIPYFFGYCD